jgi:hypothetical protein
MNPFREESAMKTPRRSGWTISLLLLASMLAGCGGSGGESPVAPDPGLAQDVADDIALQTSASVVAGKGGWLAEVEAAGAMSGSASAPAPLRWQADVPTPSYSETTFTRGGITVTMTRRFFDESGAELPSYGPTADRLLATCRASGTHESEGYSGSLGRIGWLDVHNLLASKDTLVVDGGSNDTLISQFTAMDPSHTRYFYWLSQGSIAGVRALKDRSVNPYPLSGAASWTVSVDILRDGDRGNVEKHLDATVVVVFNGTADPDLWVSGTYRYKLNLDTGLVIRA